MAGPSSKLPLDCPAAHTPDVTPAGPSRRAGTMAQDGSRRGPWSSWEDSRLLACINEEGPHNWVQVAREVGNRSAKQCRERYHQNLKPGLNHSPITAAEGRYIMEQVERRGPRWAEISRELNNNRSDNAVKNWWNGAMNRYRRQVQRQTAAGPSGRSRSGDPGPSSRRNDYSPPDYTGPAPLPSPTTVGASPRFQEASLAWSRDPLPPSPASVASDHSLAPSMASAFSAPPRRNSVSHESTFSLSGLDRSPRYQHYHARTPAILPPLSGHPRDRDDEMLLRWLPGQAPRTMPSESHRSQRDTVAAAWEAARWDRYAGLERQYYHSHQLPPEQPLPSAPPSAAANFRSRYERLELPVREQAPQGTRDGRMRVSALMD